MSGTDWKKLSSLPCSIFLLERTPNPFAESTFETRNADAVRKSVLFTRGSPEHCDALGSSVCHSGVLRAVLFGVRSGPLLLQNCHDYFHGKATGQSGQWTARLRIYGMVGERRDWGCFVTAGWQRWRVPKGKTRWQILEFVHPLPRLRAVFFALGRRGWCAGDGCCVVLVLLADLCLSETESKAGWDVISLQCRCDGRLGGNADTTPG